MMRENQYRKHVLSGYLPEELVSICNFKQSFRALQIFQWLSRGSRSFDEMTNVALADRNRLQEYTVLCNTVCETVLTDPDGTIKSEGNRKNTKLDSVWRFYDRAGHITEIIDYKDDIRSGYHKKYKFIDDSIRQSNILISAAKTKDYFVGNKKR